MNVELKPFKEYCINCKRYMDMCSGCPDDCGGTEFKTCNFYKRCIHEDACKIMYDKIFNSN